MNRDEIKQFIAERVAQGVSLSGIQDELNENGVKMTFMELRLIASEIDSSELEKLDKKKAPAQPQVVAGTPEAVQPQAEDAFPENEPETPGEAPETAAEDAAPAAEPAEPAAPRGPTVVEVSKLAMPGTVMNGSVKFGSGVTADWFLDQMGRLGLDNVVGGKPDKKDIEEFQIELRKKLGA